MRAWTGFLLLSIGCSSTTSTDGGTDSGGGPADAGDSGVAMMDSSTSNDSGGVTDSGLNGCTMFEDRGNPQAMRTITWQFNPTPKCMEIAAGQSVTWQGDFAFHPLDSLGGTTPTPIMPTSSGTSATFAFPNPGFYGYRCLAHSGLEGVVHVK